jgi:ABC-type lipoprotein release transport system permease subunit
MIIYEKMSGMSSEERKEVGILKAIGWSIDDILKEKFYEAWLVASFSYLVSVVLALLYVYILNAPLLRDIFLSSSNFNEQFQLPFIVDIQTLSLVFFLSVPLYLASVIIPVWRVATLDADEVMR